MKLINLKFHNFNIFDNVNIDISALFFEYANLDVYELLKQYVKTPTMFLHKIKVIVTDKSNDENSYELSEKTIANFYHVLFNSMSIDEQHVVIDSCLLENKSLLCVLLSNPKISLTSEQFDTIFNIDISELFNPHNGISHKACNLKIVMKQELIKNPNFQIPDDVILKEFFEKYSRFQDAYSKRKGISIVPCLIDTLINNLEHVPEEIFWNILQDNSCQLTSQQIDVIQTEYGFLERYYLSKNINFKFTDEQIINGLLDAGFSEYEIENEVNMLYDVNESDISDNYLKNPNIIINAFIISEVLRRASYKPYYIQGFLKREDIKQSNELSNLIYKHQDMI